MKNIVLIAPPAAGKGSQSEVLASKYNYKHISIGDLLREEIDNQTEMGIAAKADIDQGKLTNDELVMKLIKKVLSNAEGPFVLDGYPRTISQAEKLDELIKTLNKTIDLALFFDITEEEAVKRAIGRQGCPTCGRLYNLYEPTLNPKTPGICDKCSVELVVRSDDTESTFQIRYQTFMENTVPLLEYYEKKGILVNIAVKNTVMETFKEIEKVIL